MEEIEQRILELERISYRTQDLLSDNSRLWEKYIPMIEDTKFKAAVALETSKLMKAARIEDREAQELKLSKSGQKWVALGIIFGAITFVNPYVIFLISKK